MFGFGAFSTSAFSELPKIAGRVVVPAMLAAAALYPPEVNVGGNIQVPLQETLAIEYSPWVRSSVQDLKVKGQLFSYGSFSTAAFGEPIPAGNEATVVVPEIIAAASLYPPFVTSGGSAYNVPTEIVSADLHVPVIRSGARIQTGWLASATEFAPAVPRSMEPIRPETLLAEPTLFTPVINVGVHLDVGYVQAVAVEFSPHIATGARINAEANNASAIVYPPYISPGTMVLLPELTATAYTNVARISTGARVDVYKETVSWQSSSTFSRDSFSSTAFSGDGEQIQVTQRVSISARVFMFQPSIRSGVQNTIPTTLVGASGFTPEISARRRKIRVQYIYS